MKTKISFYGMAIILIIFANFLSSNAQTTGAKKKLSFNASDTYVDLGQNEDFKFSLSDKFTIEAWIKSKSMSEGLQQIFTLCDTLTTYHGYFFELEDGNPTFIASDGNWSTTGTIMAYVDINLRDDKWHHVAVTYNGNGLNSGISIYVDGENSNNIRLNTISGSFAPTTPFKAEIGSYGGQYDVMNGNIDELRVWNTDLKLDTIRNWMCKRISQNHPNYNNMISYYNFDEGSGNTLTDLKSDNDGVLSSSLINAWKNSGAYIGDESINTYNQSNISITGMGGDVFSANQISTNINGLHLIKYAGTPNYTNVNSSLNSIGTDYYYGVFKTNSSDTTSSFEIEYNYNGNPFVQNISNPLQLKLAYRFNNIIENWTQTNASQNITNKTFTLNSVQSSGEYVIGKITNVSVIDFNLNQLSINPNPASNFINVNINEVCSFRILDITGRVVLNEKIENNKIIDISSIKNLLDGLIEITSFAEVSDGFKTYYKKFIDI